MRAAFPGVPKCLTVILIMLIFRTFVLNSPTSINRFLRTQRSECVIITALFDIGREGYDGRSMAMYLQWFSKTLEIQTPLVVFVPHQLREFVLKSRTHPLHVESRTIERMPYSTKAEWVRRIQRSDHWIKCVKDPKRLEWHLPYYVTINWSKISLLKEVASEDPVDERYYIWVDAGG
jgi:hypothetical protein